MHIQYIVTINSKLKVFACYELYLYSQSILMANFA